MKGSQEPRIKCEPKRAYTDGDDAAQLATAYGLTPDPWQKMILDAWLGRDEEDKFTATRCGALVSRQNGVIYHRSAERTIFFAVCELDTAFDTEHKSFILSFF